MNHPSYYFALNQLESGEFLSIHQCNQDFREVAIWLDVEHTKLNIQKALKDYERNTITTRTS